MNIFSDKGKQVKIGKSNDQNKWIWLEIGNQMVCANKAQVNKLIKELQKLEKKLEK